MRSTYAKAGSALVLFAIVAAAAMFAFVSNSSAGSALQSANGHGTLTNADGSKRQFSFSARLNADGTASGQAVLRNPAFDGDNGKPYYLTVDISCMKVIGNVAFFGGTTERTNDSNLVDAAYFSVQDNGEPGKNNDKISRVFFFDDDPTTQGDPQLCLGNVLGDFPMETIDAGNIQVRAS